MHLFDPLRPKMAGKPCVLGQQFTVPWPIMKINEDMTLTLSVMLPTAEGGFTWHYAHLTPTAHLPDFVHAYTIDPEAVLTASFGWKRPAAVFLDPHFSTEEERQAHGQAQGRALPSARGSARAKLIAQIVKELHPADELQPDEIEF